MKASNNGLGPKKLGIKLMFHQKNSSGSLPKLNLDQRFVLLQELNRHLASGGRFQDHLQFLVQQVCSVLDTDACVIRELKEGDLYLIAKEGIPDGIVKPKLPADEGIAAQLIKNRLPVQINNVPVNPVTANLYKRTEPDPDHFKFLSYAGSPMLAHGDVVGIIGVYTTKCSRKFTQKDLDLLQIVANIAGMALASDRMYNRFNTANTDTRIKIMHLLEYPEKTLPDHFAKINKETVPSYSSNHHYKVEDFRLEYDLRQSEGEMSLLYQPLCTPGEGQIQGFEALLRWNHPRRGTLFPNEFIPLAERSGLINPIGLNVAQQAINDLSTLSKTSGEHSLIFINVSAVQLEDPGLVEKLLEMVEKAQIYSCRVSIEITEGVIIEKESISSQTIIRLSEAGFAIYIDDFGTGYSSMSHLLNLPIHGIKIDKSFLPKTPYDHRHQSIVETITEMAKKLGIFVIIEGIETEFQYNFAKAINVDLVQGFYINCPKPIDEIVK